MDVIVADGLTKLYDGRVGVVDVSFSVRRGEVFGYLGPNGAGKTTTIRLMLGFIKPTRGSIMVYGVDSRDDGGMARVKRVIGYVPEDFNFPRGVRGRDIVDFVARARGGAPRLKELLELFPLDLDKRVEHYSKGMKQVLAIITAFMSDPELLVLDEPTTGLDPLLRRRFLELVRSEARSGKTVFLSSHVLDEVQKVADRVCIIKDGRIVALESLESLLEKSGKVIQAKLNSKIDVEELRGIPGVTRVYVEGDTVTIIARSGYNEIFKILADHDIADIEVRSMTLEEVFIHFYRR